MNTTAIANITANVKTFDCGGFTLHKGTVKARVANGLVKRVKTLKYYGHEDIHFVMLPTAMSKADATKWLVDNKEWVYANAHEHMGSLYEGSGSNANNAATVAALATVSNVNEDNVIEGEYTVHKDMDAVDAEIAELLQLM